MLCRANEETADHLFTQCVFTKFVLVMGVEGVQSRDLGDDVYSFWDRWSSIKGLHNSKSSLIDLVGNWLVIWKVRNELTLGRSRLTQYK